MSDAGKINFGGTFGLLILVFGLGAIANVVQVVVRIWNDDYTTGLPSATSAMVVYGLILLGSVLMVVVGQRSSKNK